MCCSLPFSWRIRSYLEELWVLALQQEGKGPPLGALWVLLWALSHECMCTPGRTQQEFDELFWKTPLGRYVGKAHREMQVEFYQRYLQDFVCMTMNVTFPRHLKVIFL